MEDGEDYVRGRDVEREDETAGADEPIYEDDENENNEHQIVDEHEDHQNNDTVDQDAVADDNNGRRGRHQRITETVPDKDVNNLYITNLSFQVCLMDDVNIT